MALKIIVVICATIIILSLIFVVSALIATHWDNQMNSRQMRDESTHLQEQHNNNIITKHQS